MSEEIHDPKVEATFQEPMVLKGIDTLKHKCTQNVGEQITGENFNQNKNQRTEPQNTEEFKLQTREKTEEKAAKVSDSTFSEVLDILLEVLNKVSSGNAVENIESSHNDNNLVETELQYTEEQTLQAEEKPRENGLKGSNVDSTFSKAHEILRPVVSQVSSGISGREKFETSFHEIARDTNKDSKLIESCNEMETGVFDVVQNGRQRHGVKRSCDHAALDGVQMTADDDSSYIMNLVQEELDAVEKQLDTKKDVKIVDYDNSDSDESSSSDEESSESSSSDSESTSSESSTDERITIADKVDSEDHEKLNVGAAKTKDEILLNDLPPEPLVELVLADDVNLRHIGVIISIVDCIVVIKALPKVPAVDADTLLFLENRKCLGKVFETFGPVQSPFYSVRFNSPDSITKAAIKADMMVYFVPDDFDMTKLIFTSQIEKLKGSDASWKHDQEPPDELIEYSDDEEEKVAKAKKKQARKATKHGQNGVHTGVSSQNLNTAQQRRESPHTFQRQARPSRNAHRIQERHSAPGVGPPRPSREGPPLPRGASLPPGIHRGLLPPRLPMPNPPQGVMPNHPPLHPQQPHPPPSHGLPFPPLLGPHEHPGYMLLCHAPRPFQPGHIPPPRPGQFAPASLQRPYPHYQPPPPPAMPSSPGAFPPWPPLNLRPT